MNRSLTNVFLAVLTLASSGLAGPDDPRSALVLELKGRSIPENSIDLVAGNEAPEIVPVIVVGMSAKETADAFDAAMLLAPSEVRSVSVALVAHELTHVVQQGAAKRETVAHELTHVVQQGAAKRELAAHELTHVVQQGAAKRELLGHELAHVVQQAARGGEPGVVHLILWKALGVLDQASLYDRTGNDEVWNQPLRGSRLAPSDSETALEMVLQVLTNTQKSKHDAAMAAIQNTR